MKKLTRDLILQADDLPTTEVEVPEWGGWVTVRGLTGAERDLYEQGMLSMIGPSVELNMANARARLVALCVVDEAGERLFSDQDVLALSQKSGAALDRVFQIAQKLSGLSNSDLGELTGRFFATLGAGSSSS